MRVVLLLSLISIAHSFIYSQSTEIWGNFARSNNQDLGCIFKIDSSNNEPQIVKTFHRNADGSSSLVKAGDGKYYGVRKYGGKYGNGVIYVVDPTTKESKEIFHFNFGWAYSELTSGLMEAQAGELWGMAAKAGVNYDGVIYKYNYINGNFSIAFDINSISSDFPNGGLVKAPNGKLYGLAREIKNSRRGCIFEIDLVANTITRRYRFLSTNYIGIYPNGEMVVAPNGKLYGICPLGGSFTGGQGTLFEYDYQTHNVIKRKTFINTDSIGDYPITHLLLADNGKLYGSTSYGGASGHGSIFEYSPSTNTMVKKLALDSTFNKLSFNVDDGNGRILGFNYTNTSTYEHSMIVEYFPASNKLNTLYTFSHVFIGSVCKDTTNKYFLGGDIVMEFDSTFNRGEFISMSDRTIDGGKINSPMAYGLDKKLYGYSSPEISHFEPIIFRINPLDYKYEMIKRFAKKDSIWNLSGTFLVHPDSNLYAAFASTPLWTPPPGYNNHAGIIQVNPKTDSVKLVYKFPNNLYEIGSLQLDSAQNFYGVGRKASGTTRYNYLFKVHKSLDSIEILHTFNINNSIFKFTDILIDSNLIIGLYNHLGPKMFKYFIQQDSISTVTLNGGTARGSIVEGQSSIYYGLLQDEIIEYNLHTNQVRTIVDFTTTQALVGRSPRTLSYHNGILYGINYIGPNKYTNSAIFSYDTRLTQSVLTLIHEFDSIEGTVDYDQRGENLIVLEICRPSERPNLKLTTDTICPSGKSIITVDSSNLENGYTWALYDDTLAQPLQVDTIGSFTVSPLNSKTFYVKGLAHCFSNAPYGSIDLIVDSTYQINASHSISVCRNGYFVRPSGDTLFSFQASFIDTTVFQTINTACDSVVYTQVLVDSANIESSHSISVCKNGYFIRPSGDTLFDLQVSFIDTTVLQTTYGQCDSVVYTQVLVDTVNINASHSVSVCKNGYFIRPSGDTLFDLQASFIDTTVLKTTHRECDSVVYTQVQVDTLNVNISQNRNTLTSLNLNATSYQWYDCLNDTLMNVNTRIFNAVNNGSYAVILSEKACIDTSKCVQVLSVHLPEEHLSEQVHLSPNPTDGKFTLYLFQAQSIQIRIRNMQGKLIYEQTYPNQKQIELHLDGSTGIYFVELLSTKGEQVNYKVIKQ